MNLNDLLAKNEHLKNRHAGMRCFILGNGPSINSQNLSLLKNEITIVVNSFFSHPDPKIIEPQYWVIADPDYWIKPDEFFFPAFKLADEKATNIRLFLPTGGFSFFSTFNRGPLIDLHFFHYDHSKNIDTIIDFSKGIPPYGQNVIMISMMLAFHMGCNPIYLIGCDHDFTKFTKDEYANAVIKHFYSSSKPDVPQLTWEQWQDCIMRMDYEYEQLKKYASLWGFNVFNATRGGCLETFPRVEYESLFPLGNRNESSLSKVAIEPSHLGQAALKLINSGDILSALALVDEALRRNISRHDRTEGLQYLKAICLAKLRLYNEALLFARQDRDCNPANRENSVLLIRQLEESIKGAQSKNSLST